MNQDKRKIIFISSKQDELEQERNCLRDLIEKDELLSKMFITKSFEHDLLGRKESISEITKEWVLKSDVYFGIFDRKYSEPTAREYEIACNDKVVKKEMIIFVRRRDEHEREGTLNKFLSFIMNPSSGHACVMYISLKDLLKKTKEVLLRYKGRCIEGFLISEEALGKNLEGARHTNFPEKLRRGLLQPLGRFMIPRGRKGVYEFYRYDENGIKVDVTWESLQYERKVSEEIKDFYKKRYKKPFDGV